MRMIVDVSKEIQMRNVISMVAGARVRGRAGRCRYLPLT